MPINKTRPQLIVLAIATSISTACYVLWSHFYYRVGYPLDDSWIYQTYARNLSLLGEWSFVPGEASGGSTGPLWVLFLFPGYLMRIEYRIWSYLLGSMILFGVGVIGMRVVKTLQPEVKNLAFLAGLILIFEWHLVWASVSGMETLLSAFLISITLVYLIKAEIRPIDWLLIGFLVGTCVWIRPDGITLLGPVGFVVFWGSKKQRKEKIKQGLLAIIGFAIPFGFYLLFNQITSGTIWPNTFYAKQAEYAGLQNISYIFRYAQMFIAPITGVGVTLLPGFLSTLFRVIRERKWALLASFLWFFGYLAIFAWRLPVTYQHGRYVIPAMPIFFILGLAGTLGWIKKYWRNDQMVLRVLSKSWLIVCLIIPVIFWFSGAKAFAEEVAFIESEMVTTAKWISTNTNQNALIAAHDIGALGYFSDRKIVDMAGLISPDVIPFIQDQQKLSKYLNAKEVDYLMTFPDWYPSLISHSTLVFQTDTHFSVQLGGENMAVYKWDGRKFDK